ncbi:MAG TPA: hypothetical protein VGJ04_00830, partial [Pirellulales bacterium]
MKRILGMAAAMALCIGCRGPSQVYDPFLGRTTVDPPGTATPPPAQQYYGAPGVTTPTAPPVVLPPQGTGAAPVPRVGSPYFSPAPAGGGGLTSSFTPNVSTPQPTPAAAPGRTNPLPITPVSNSPRPVYASPGAPGYPQARAPAATGTPTPVQAAATVQTAAASAAPPAALDVDRILASRGSNQVSAVQNGAATAANGNTADGAIAATTAAFTSPASSIRIVEPTAGTAPIASGPPMNNSDPAGTS